MPRKSTKTISNIYVKNRSTVKIIPEAIPIMEQKILCAAFLDAILRFYEDPENMAAYKRHMGKGGPADGQEDG